MLGMIEDEVCEDEGIEACRSGSGRRWGILIQEMGEEVRGRCAPAVALDDHHRFWRGQKWLHGRNVMLEVIEELLVWVIRDHDLPRAQHGSHETGKSRTRTELQDIFPSG